MCKVTKFLSKRKLHFFKTWVLSLQFVLGIYRFKDLDLIHIKATSSGSFFHQDKFITLINLWIFLFFSWYRLRNKLFLSSFRVRKLWETQSVCLWLIFPWWNYAKANTSPFIFISTHSSPTHVQKRATRSRCFENLKKKTA